MSTFNPTAIAGAAELPPKDHNQPEPAPFDLVKQEIEDLFDTAKDFADGEPIGSQEMHDQIERIRDQIHDAGKRAEVLRKAEKDPLDALVKAVQDKFNPLTQKDRGKVDMAKSALDTLLTPWRAAKAAAAQAEAARVAAAAAEATRIATEAIRASSGNLAARESAEEQLADAKRLEKTARRWDKAATTGTGLRTVWVATMKDAEAGLDWAYARSPERFAALVQQMADEAVRSGVRTIPGFVVEDKKVAA